MTTLQIERVSHALAAEVRAAIARQGLTQGELARRIGHNGPWLSGRISPRATVDITVDEAVEMAEALGVSAEDLIVAALCACRDSNPKPSDLVFCDGPQGVNRTLTVLRRYRDSWELAA